MTQENAVNLKRMKHLFLLFLKQFEVDEYKFLMSFLQLIINKYNLNPSTLFGYLTNQVDKEDIKTSGASSYTNRRFLNPNHQKFAKYNHRDHDCFDEKTTPGSNEIVANSSQSKQRLIQAKSRLEHISNKIISKAKSVEEEQPAVVAPTDNMTNLDLIDEDNIKFDENDDDEDIDYLDENYNESTAAKLPVFNMEMLKNRTDIIDSFIMKENETEEEEIDQNGSQFDLNEEFNPDEDSYYDYQETPGNEEHFKKYTYQNEVKSDSLLDLNYEDEENELSKYYDEPEHNDEFDEEENGYYESPGAAHHLSQPLNNSSASSSRFNISYYRNEVAAAAAAAVDANPLDNSKLRVRKFSESIRNELERKFLTNNFISGVEKSQLAIKLNLTERQVQKWFVHRREKLRRLEKKAGALTGDADTSETAPTKATVKSGRKSEATSANTNSGRVSNRLKQTSCDLNKNPYRKVYLTRKSADFKKPHSTIKEEPFAHQELSSHNYGDEEEENLFETSSQDYTFPLETFKAQMGGEEEEELPLEYEDEQFDESEQFFENFDEDDEENFENSHDFEESKENTEYSPGENGEMEDGSKSAEGHHHHHRQYAANDQDDLMPAAKRKCLSVPRRLFPPHVVTHLESLFDKEKYIKENQIEEISLVTNLNEKQIRSWFKQRRFRYNLENKEKGIDQDYGFKQRTMLPKSVANELEKAFIKNNYVYGNDKKNLSKQLNLKPIQLERWFYYRRKKQSNTAAN